MTTPKQRAAASRNRNKDLDHTRRMQRIRDRRRAGTQKKRDKDQRWRDENRLARQVSQRCKVSMKVARRWIEEGRVPDRKYQKHT